MKLENKVLEREYALINESTYRGNNNQTGMKYKPGEPQEYGIVVGILLLGFAAYRIIRKKFRK